ncbi:MAG TPA: Flp family type IVb pilin [Acidiphilium sp.]
MLTYTKAWLALRGISLVDDKRGVTALEYGMIAALIAAVIVGVLGTLGGQLNTMFTSLSKSL